MFFTKIKKVYKATVTTEYVSSAVALDINGDGYLDVVSGYDYFNPDQDKGIKLQVMKGGKGGTFKDGSDLISGGIPSPIAPHRELVADFNGDGKLDLFIGNSGYDSPPFPGTTNTLLLSTGTGRLKAAPMPDVDVFLHGAAMGDIDNDNDIDILVGPSGGQSGLGVHFLVNDGSGQFTADATRFPEIPYTTSKKNWTSVQLADFDKDGDLDAWLGALHYNEDNVVLANDGTGHFTDASGVRPHEGEDIYALYTLTLDVNNDGLLDILQAEGETGSYGTSFVGVYINRGNLEFANESAQRIFGLSKKGDEPFNHITRIHVADFNKDGAADILAEINGGPAQILINNGDGIFARPQNGVIATAGGRVVVADFDKDGRPDILSFGDEPRYAFLQKIDDGAQIRMTGGGKADKLFGTAKGNTIKGEGGSDYIRSGAGKDKLYGGEGKDKLLGGTGKDKFVFDTKLGKANVDQILDFAPGDKVLLEGAIFKSAGKNGTLGDNRFHAADGATSAQDAADRIVYDTLTGRVYFDSDGVGGKAAVHFATFHGLPGLTAADFLIV